MILFFQFMLAGYMPSSFAQWHNDIAFQNAYLQTQQEAMSAVCDCLGDVHDLPNSRSFIYFEKNSAAFWEKWSDPQKRNKQQTLHINGKNTLPHLHDSFPNVRKLILMNVHHDSSMSENPLNLHQFKKLTHLEISYGIRLNPLEWKLLSRNPIRSIQIRMSGAKDIPFHLFPFLREIQMMNVGQVDYGSFSKNTQLKSIKLYKVSGINTLDQLDVNAFPCLKTLRILDLKRKQKNFPRNLSHSLVDNLDVYHFNLSKAESGMHWSMLQKRKKATENRSLPSTKTLVEIN